MEQRTFGATGRLVTFLGPRDFKLFRELAYQRNQCTAELLRCILREYLDPPPRRGRKPKNRHQ